jgi:N-acetylated-alpha-linked acidic dipeptidase
VHNAVAYLNLDAAVQGHDLRIGAMPMFTNIVESAMKMVIAPSEDKAGNGQTVYDEWVESKQSIGLLGSGSDYVAFQHHRGIPSINLNYEGMYGVYHSAYDTTVYMDHVDKDFEYHRAGAQLFGLLAYRLADKYVVPLDVREFGLWVNASVSRMLNEVASSYSCHIDADRVSEIERSSMLFRNEADDFQTLVEALNTTKSGDSYVDAIRDANDAIKYVARQFLETKGMPQRPYMWNTLFTATLETGYGYEEWPQILYAIKDGCVDAEVRAAVNQTSWIIMGGVDFLAQVNGQISDE